MASTTYVNTVGAKAVNTNNAPPGQPLVILEIMATTRKAAINRYCGAENDLRVEITHIPAAASKANDCKEGPGDSTTAG